MKLAIFTVLAASAAAFTSSPMKTAVSYMMMMICYRIDCNLVVRSRYSI
jgi:hypothetical protein